MESGATGVRPDDDSLRSKAVRGAGWAVVAMGGGSALKLASSLILTRLLYPEAFGLMVTASLLIMALELLADIGLVQAIIQHNQGEESRYLDTAWTLQVIRGWVLAGAAVAAAYPFASFYGEEALAPIIMVTALGPLLRGFGSPALFLLQRRLELRRLAIMELVCNALRVAATIIASLILRNVWALVLGGIFGEACWLIMSFLIMRYRPHLTFEAAAARAILGFGRFILLSGILGFACSRLDVVLVPKFLGMATAGVYSIAVAMAMMLTMLLNNVIDRTLFPAFCRLKDDSGRLRARQHEVLEIYCTLALPLILLVAANADLLIELIYDPRYAGAGLALRWLLVAVAIQGLVRLLNVPIMATGRPYVGAIAALGSLAVLCLALYPQVVRASIQGYAAARFVASLALIVPVVSFSLKLRHRTVQELCWYLRPVLAMFLALAMIHGVCMWLGDSIGWRIARAGAGTLLVTPALLFWQRTVLVHTIKEVIRFAPRLPRRSRDTVCCKEELSV